MIVPALVAILVWLALIWPPRELRRIWQQSSDPIGFPAPRRWAGTRVGTIDTALLLDLLAVALSSGLPVGFAMAVVGDSVRNVAGDALATVGRAMGLGADLDQAFDAVVDLNRDPAAETTRAALEVIRSQLAVSVRSGAAVCQVLRTAAVAQRQADRREAQARAGRLGVLLVLPLGLCALPSFVALAVVPVVISLAREFLG